MARRIRYGTTPPEAKKSRKVDKSVPLITKLDNMALNVALAFAHHQKFTYVDFLNLFVEAGVRDCLLRASEVAHSNCTYHSSASIPMAYGGDVRVTLQGVRFLMPKEPVLAGLQACNDLELRQRFVDHVERKREMAVGFARARVVVKHLVDSFDPHVATYLLPSLQVLAEGTEYAKQFVPAGVGRVPTLLPIWREACKRVAATITAAQLVQKYDAYPEMDVWVQLASYDHADLYESSSGDEADVLTLSVKDTN